MAITAEQLVFQLSAKVTGFEDEIQGAASVFNRATARIEAGFSRMDQRIAESSRASRVNARSLIATATGILGAREVMQYADAWSRARNALISARVPAEQQAAVLERLYDQAQRYSTDLNAQVGLYGSVSRAAAGLTSNQEDLFRFTEAVAAALKADGQSAAQAAGPLLQLGQALRSPVIQAEEFNSLIDGAPALLEAAARGITKYNGSVGALTADAKSGRLASRDFFAGILAGADELQNRVSGSVDTFEGAFQKISNALTKYIGQTDEGLGASSRLIAGLSAFADDFDNIADKIIQFGSVIAGALVGRAALGGVATFLPPIILGLKLLSVATTAGAASASLLAARFGTAASSIVSATVATRAFRLAAASMLAGPVGLIIGGVVASVVAFGGSVDEASEYTETAAQKAERYARALRRIKDEATDAGNASAAAGERFRQTEINRTTQQLAGDVGEAAALEQEFTQILDRFLNPTIRSAGGAQSPFEGQLRALRDSLGESAEEAVDAQEKLNAFANDNPQFQGLADRLNPLLEMLQGIRLEIRGAEDDLKEMAVTPPPLTRLAQEVGMGELSTASGVLSERDRLAARSTIEAEIEKRAKEIAKAIEEAGGFISEAGARLAARREVETERQRTLIDGNSGDAIDRYVSRVIAAETGGHPDPNRARNPDSTATGLGQFIEGTWIDLFKRHFPDRAAGLSNAAILAFRTNADDSKRLIEAYARENADVLRGAGVAVTETALQLSHFLGVGDAVKVLSAAPGTPLSGLISGASIRANPTILGGGRTVDDAIAYGDKRANNTRIAAGDLTPQEEAIEEATKKRREMKAAVDDLLASVSAETKETLLQTSLIGASTSERERAMTMLQLENDLKREGITLDREGNGVNAEGVVIHRNLRATLEELASSRANAIASGEESEAYNQIVADVTNYIAAKNDEARALNLSAEAASALRHEMDLLNQITGAGITLTPQIIAQVEQMASGMAAAEFASERLRESQEQMRDISKDATRGLVDDLIAGKTAAEAFAGALSKIADRLLDMAVDNLFEGMFANGGGGMAGGIGGFISSLLGGRRANGGSVRAGRMYEVNERGQEYFVPGRSGTIVPHDISARMQAPALRPVNVQASGSTIKVFDQRSSQSEPVDIRETGRNEFEVYIRDTARDEITTSGRRGNQALKRGFGMSQGLVSR